MNLVKIWSTANYSTWQISDALSQLRVSHSVRIDSRSKDLIVNCKKPQPMWVYVGGGVTFFREDSVNFIVASSAELSYTNFPKLPNAAELTEVIKYALEYPVAVSPIVKKMSNMDYVNSVTKPSILNEVQTLVYKIQPYSLRKEVQGLVLSYFNSRIGQKTLEYSLKRSLKTIGLIPVLRKGLVLRAAVARLKSESVEAVAADTGLETFELLYLSKERKK